MWVEQSYKQVKQALGWAEYQVRSDLAMRRHWVLVWCAFSFCWWHLRYRAEERPAWLGAAVGAAHTEQEPREAVGREKNQPTTGRRRPEVGWPVALRKVRAWLENPASCWDGTGVRGRPCPLPLNS